MHNRTKWRTFKVGGKSIIDNWCGTYVQMQDHVVEGAGYSYMSGSLNCVLI